MRRALTICLLSAFFVSLTCGCWNYRSLDQMDIVVGIAIDYDKASGQYLVSYECADLINIKDDSGVSGRLVQATGPTLFETARNAKRKEADKLFFGSASLLIISEEIAHDPGLMPLIDWFIRDGECRETMCVAVSQEETANMLLEKDDEKGGLTSLTLHDIIKEDKKTTASSIQTKLYQLYNTLHGLSHAAMLPAFHQSMVGDEPCCEINGLAVFKGGKLAGYLDPDESKYVLFVEDELKGGLLTLPADEMPPYSITLEVFGNSSKKSFAYEQGKVIIRIETDTRVAIAENPGELDVMDLELIGEIEDAAARMIEQKTKDMIAKVQSEYRADVFGFGEMIYKKDPALWAQLEPVWEELYPEVEVEVSSQVQVINSAFVK